MARFITIALLAALAACQSTPKEPVRLKPGSVPAPTQLEGLAKIQRMGHAAKAKRPQLITTWTDVARNDATHARVMAWERTGNTRWQAAQVYADDSYTDMRPGWRASHVVLQDPETGALCIVTIGECDWMPPGRQFLLLSIAGPGRHGYAVIEHHDRIIGDEVARRIREDI